MNKYYKFYVHEDNAGGLHLLVYDKYNTPVFYHTGYERNIGFLSVDLDALMNGDSPETWEGNKKDEIDYIYLGWESDVIVEGDTVNGVTYDYSLMGNAGLREFWR